MDYLALFTAALNRSKKVLSSLHINRDMMQKHVDAGYAMLAEPLYILLTMGGVHNAYEKVRSLSHIASKEPISLIKVMKKQDPQLWEVCERQLQLVGFDAGTFFSHPQQYMGKVVQKVERTCALAKEQIQKMRTELDPFPN